MAKSEKAPTKVSKKFLDWLASWEGERLKAYKVPGEDFYTIGVGHTGKVDGKKITASTQITKEESRDLLSEDIEKFEKLVKKHIPERWRTERGQFEAMVSLAFNMGEEILTPEPPLTTFAKIVHRKNVSPANIRQAAYAIRLYDKGGSPLRRMRGLVRRRDAESRLFLTGEYRYNK